MVYYFSGTGNSKYVAKRIAKEIKDNTKNIVDLLDEQNIELNLNKNENIGIVFPTYYFGPPLIIEEFFKFLETINISDGSISNRLIYIVFTYEAYAGGMKEKLISSLKEKHINLNYIDSVKMPNNFSIYYDLKSIEEENIILEKAENKVDEIILNIKNLKVDENINNEKYNNYTFKVKGKKDIVGLILTKVLYPIYKNGRKTRRFYADNKCINCGFCEQICPSKAIKMQNNKPKWIKKQCEYCLACYNRCPMNAIQVGNLTKNRRRYYNSKLDNKK